MLETGNKKISQDVEESMRVIEKAVQELLEKETDLMRGGMIAGALSNIKFALSIGDMYKEAVDKLLES